MNSNEQIDGHHMNFMIDGFCFAGPCCFIIISFSPKI